MTPPPSGGPPPELDSDGAGGATSDGLGGDATLVGDATIGPSQGARARPLGRGDAVGRYLLVEPLGRGAMGQVFRAYDPDLDRQLAIKILFGTQAPERERLLDEAKAMARIDHAHVVTVHDVGVHEDTVFIAMELVDGPSMDRWLETPRGPQKILDVLLGAARGLAAAHAAGVIHRDFKPSNVLVTPDGRAKVGDFGLAGLEDDTTATMDGTPERGGALGTPGYMSPEHIAGVGVDARSDQFSFGVTLYEALHGQRPFSATTWPALAVQVLEGEVVPELAGRGRGVDGVIRRALSVDPHERYPTMDALVAALERTRRRVWPYGLAAAALVAGALGTFLAPRTHAEVCVPGHQLVEAWWDRSARSALQIGGRDYTEEFAQRGRERFAAALDEYAARWSAAHDEVCAVVGPRRDRGTASDRSQAQCLDNRRESLRGLVELVTTRPLTVGRVDDLVQTLPDIEGCAEGLWVPYPAEPERARRAAALFRTFTRIERERRAEQGEDLPGRAEDAVAQARALGEPYLLARTLGLHARTIETTERSSLVFAEALEVAVGGGFDLLAADIVNQLVLAKGQRRSTQWAEISQLVAMARGLVTRGGGDERLLGDLTTNEADALRRAGRYEPSLALFEQAEEHYRRAEEYGGATVARLNQAIVMFEQGRTEDALPIMREMAEAFGLAAEAASPRAIQARLSLIVSLLRLGRTREAFARANRLHEFVSEHYTLHSYSRRRVILVRAHAALEVGDTEVLSEMLDVMRSAPEPSAHERIEVRHLEVSLAQQTGRFDDCLALLDELEASELGSAAGPELASTTYSRGNCLLVLGRRDDVKELLVQPWLVSYLVDPQGPSSLRLALARLGALADAPPPQALGSWRSVIPADGTTGGVDSTRWSAEIIEAITAAGEPVEDIRRIRQEMVEGYHERDIAVQVLDRWLREHAAG